MGFEPGIVGTDELVIQLLKLKKRKKAAMAKQILFNALYRSYYL